MLEEPQLQPFLLRTVWAPIMHPRPILPSWHFSNRKCTSGPFELVKRESPKCSFPSAVGPPIYLCESPIRQRLQHGGQGSNARPCPLGRLLFDENPFRRLPASWPNRYD